MWLKLSEKEKNEEEANDKAYFKENRLRRALKYSLFIFVFVLVLNSISSVYIGVPNGRHNPAPRARIEWQDLSSYLPRFLVLAGVLATIVFLVGYNIQDKRSISKTLICDRCFKTQKFTNDALCECGGNLDFLSNYKWIDEPDAEKTT